MTDPRLTFAEALAREAGALALSLRDDPTGLVVEVKGPQDFVTAADKSVENLIRQAIGTAYPDEAILGEEGGLTGDVAACWIIDPIDGTTNFMRGGSEWAISIGYFDGQQLSHGVIYAPDLDLLVSGSADTPATMNGKQVRVSDRSDPGECLVELGFSRRLPTSSHTDLVFRLLDGGSEYRRRGSATIALLSVATGRSEAFYEQNINSWDAAAGIAIVRAAGGTAEHPDFPGFLQTPGPVFVSNGAQSVYALCTGCAQRNSG